MALDFSKYGKKHEASCESCEYFTYDEYTDSHSCNLSLDEDEMGDFLCGTVRACPYYKYYDEYTSVRKQI